MKTTNDTQTAAQNANLNTLLWNFAAATAETSKVASCDCGSQQANDFLLLLEAREQAAMAAVFAEIDALTARAVNSATLLPAALVG